MKYMGQIGGKWVELPKDCGCLPEIHEGPHWIHADASYREANLKLYDRCQAGDVLGCFGFAQEEGARLREKRYQMEALGIEAYRVELPDEMKARYPDVADIKPTFLKPTVS